MKNSELLDGYILGLAQKMRRLKKRIKTGSPLRATMSGIEMFEEILQGCCIAGNSNRKIVFLAIGHKGIAKYQKKIYPLQAFS